jgi:hypothetical protein
MGQRRLAGGGAESVSGGHGGENVPGLLGAQAFSNNLSVNLLREMALKALRHETSKGSLRSKRKRASLDPSFRLGLLLALHA